MKLRRAECLVFLVTAAILCWNLWNVGMASGYIDPIMRFGAQDEATYTREAITMAHDGGWMTPTFIGRWVFEKPPLLVWLSALSMKMLGVGRLTARLPAVFAGAIICALCFGIVGRARGTLPGVAAALMAVSSQILFTLSRHTMTDILLAAAGMCAFAVLASDPDLKHLPGFLGFVAAAAAGIMAKSLAGILVLAVMGAVVGLGRRRPTRALLAGISAIILASPWFLYNLILHRNWFLADMGFQIITIGTTAHQTSPENHFWFYLRRIGTSDLIPFLLAITALPALVRALRERNSTAILAASYLVIYFAALMVFQFHSEQYLCWFIPSLVLLAGLYSPLLSGKAAGAVIAAVILAFAIKLCYPEREFGISVQSGSTIPSAPALERYCGEHRATDLYVLNVDDEFYSAVLPLHQVRYGWLDPQDFVAREHPNLAYLGILVPAAELPQLARQIPLYRDRLRSWGLASTAPIATGLPAHNPAALRQIVLDHPESDFLVPFSIQPAPGTDPAHRVVYSGPDFVLLESTSPVSHQAPAWTCGL